MDNVLTNEQLINVSYPTGFTMVPNNLLFDDRVSGGAKDLLVKIIAYYNNPQKSGDNWTIKRAANYFGLSEYIVGVYFKELIQYGYLYVEKRLPHKYNNDSNDLYDKKYHNRITFVYYFYTDPKENPHYKEGNMDVEELNKELQTDVIKIEKPKKKKVVKTIKEKVKNTEDLIETSNETRFYQIALNRWKQSNYYNVNCGDLFTVEVDDKIKEYIKDNIGSVEDLYDIDIDELSDFCWNCIVMSKTYNDKAFQSYRYSKAGEEMAKINTTAIKQIYNSCNTYKKGLSNINLVNEMEAMGKLFMLQSTAAIYNYCKLNFLGDNLPVFKEVLGLYKTLADHPELICLDVNKEGYSVLDKFFNKNQEQYIKKE